MYPGGDRTNSGFFRRWVLPLLAAIEMGAFSSRADQIIYDDSLENGWQNWGWATINYANTTPVHSGSDSISVTMTGWGGIQIWHSDMDSSLFTNLSFWLNGGSSGGQKLQVYGLVDTGGTNNFALSARYQIGPLSANTWQHFTVPLSALGAASLPNFTGFVIQDSTGTGQPTLYLDDITLMTNALSSGTNTPVSITVDAGANRHAISPLIYGTAFASASQLSDLNVPLNRSGGNSETSYNWQINAHNHAADWYFESLPDSPATPGASTDTFVASSRSGGAQAMITIPMIGWAPRLGTNGENGDGRLASYSIAKYGPQTGNDSQWFPDAGNGVGTNSANHTSWLITTNEPNDANVPVNSTFQQGYVRHLTNAWGNATNGGVRFFIMDNEHSLWQSTHQDVHPVGPTMQEIRDKIFDYASMVKSNDPNALVCGPEEWGWPGYLYSGYDWQWAGAHNDYNPAHFPDRTVNGGWDYMPWLLDQLRQHDSTTGVRLLDYFTLHCYPQEGSVGGNAVDSATELLRNQSTRVFWDTNYVDPSWINSVIALIPRMKNWSATYYPGTKIGVTEYNWGAESSINGATAQADILGIFGRENLDLATRWTTPDAGTPTYKAIKIYRNYDGNKSSFGDTSVLTTVPNPDNLSAFSAVRTADGALTIMVINKDILNASPINASLANFAAAGTAQRWQLTTANVITRLADTAITGNVLTDTVPSQSITLYVLPPAVSFHLAAAPVTTPGQITLWLNGQAGQSYALQSSTDLIHWATIGTNLLSSNSVSITILATNLPGQFYRGLWLQ